MEIEVKSCQDCPFKDSDNWCNLYEVKTNNPLRIKDAVFSDEIDSDCPLRKNDITITLKS